MTRPVIIYVSIRSQKKKCSKAISCENVVAQIGLCIICQRKVGIGFCNFYVQMDITYMYNTLHAQYCIDFHMETYLV